MNRPVVEYPDLPVSARRADIIAALKASPILILCGETGSGKTTQIPKMCLEAELGRQGSIGGGLIGCTQPRRIAARSVAQRVAEELKGELGGLVGYKVRFTDKVRRDTRIKFMTDGILLAESQGDPMLSAYSCIVVDEAHERSLNIDFLLGYLRTLIELRPDLKLVITSATIDAEKFSAHFGNAPVIEVSGRTYPVEMRYRPIQGEGEREKGEGQGFKGQAGNGKGSDESDLIQGILDATDELAREGWGDTLIFLPGEREIRETAEALRKHHPPHTEILPLFARLSVEEQDRIFRPGNARRIVLSTNVAETSLTVPGIRYVIDTGQARVKRYSARNKVEQLLIEKISQASANQRAGRCGRVSDGICIRLYDEADFQSRPRFTDPELLRSSLAGVILRMKSLGLGAVESFPFIDPPHSRFIADGYSLLHELNALDDRNELTETGRRIARLPLDPRMARMILAAERSGSLAEMLMITSFLSVQDPRERPQERAGSADEKHKLFADERSDFLGVVKLWNWFDEQIKHKKSNRQLRDQLADHFLSSRRMREWRDVHGQLATQCAELGLRLNEKPAGYDALHQSLLTGLLGNIGFRSEDAKARPGLNKPGSNKPGDGVYQGARGLRYGLHPASVLVKKGTKWVVAAELTDTGRLLGRMAAEVRPEWIEAAAQHVIERSYSEPHWDRKSARVLAFERVTLYGVTLASRRKVHYGPIEPDLSRELFIRGALVAGEYDTEASWLKHNLELIAHIEELEHKARKSGVWLDEERIFAFFDARIPPGMHNGPAFEKWLKTVKPDLLKLSREDIVAEGLDLSQGLYPETIEIDGISCTVKYRFEPGHPLDGATLSLPLYLLNRVNEAQLDWAIPGLLRDRVNALFKAMPKEIRNAFVPLAQSVTTFLGEAVPGKMPLAEAISTWVEKRTKSRVMLREADMPPHLKLNMRVLDDSGQELAMGRDLTALRQQLGETASLAYGQSEVRSEHEREGITAWDFGDLPERVNFVRNGQQLTGYPALIDEGEAVAMKLMDTPEGAEAASSQGVIRLLRIALAPQFKQLEKDLGRQTALALKYRGLGNADTFFGDLLDTIADRACLGDDPLPRRQKEFDKQKERAKPRIAPVMQALLRSVETCLDLYPQVQARLNQKTPYTHAQKDEQTHLPGLVYPGFIRATPWERWQHLPRYLQAILKRFDKLPAAGERDPRHTAVIQGLEKRYQERLAKHRKAGVNDPALAEFRWHLEELRVSLFAQELKTPYPVSAKRLEKLWESVQS